MKKHIEVVAAIIEKDGKYFCAQRADHGELAKKWEFPGGKIEPGESHQEALTREIKEELDSFVIVDEFIMTVEHEYNGFILTMHAYGCALELGLLLSNEHIDSKWMTLYEMNQYDFAEADKPIIEKLKQKISNES